ncbi:hypothetical protein HME9304_01125 [Flagellimonas maritima]|uniref:Thioredoxin family protein n=1 Tax=Flagellimonas maritima TaxID=1383885 RepID=A0A2Z4LQK3_9FLAO|nr:thioredoxin family protein [Allomuricauda aurantiaca]AWX44125.1 hypothetical protein HME9304_01125 [Allomuricauda aurantiaca]
MQNEKLGLIKRNIAMGMDYEAYRKLVHDLAKNGKTTGDDPSESLVNYTQLNDRRMNRWDKTLKIPINIAERVSKMKSKLTFLVISESWCGDASPSLPVLNKIADLNPNIEFKIVLRDENPELMDSFLTNGSRSIPKLIIWDRENDHIIGEWGPRSSFATKLVEDYKRKNGKLTAEFKQDLQLWYNKDKGLDIINDLAGLLPLK